MGPGETTALVVVIVAVLQGLFKLISHLINKNSENGNDGKLDRAIKQLDFIKEKVIRLDDMHYKFDPDGTPMWYVPRAWNETQAKIVEKLERLSHTELQILSIIERLERRLESLHGLEGRN